MFQDHDVLDERGAADRFKTGQVYSRLKNVLVFQKVPPHTKLDAGVLADRLNMSRTPVREALIHLAFEGVISNVPGSGYYTKPLDADEISDDYDLALTILQHIVGAISSRSENPILVFQDSPGRRYPAPRTKTRHITARC